MLEAFSLPARFERDLLILSNFTHNSMKQEIYLYPFYKKEKKKKAQEMETLRKLSTVTECEFKVWCLVLNHVFK